MTWDAVHDSRRVFMSCLRAQCAPGSPVSSVPRAGISADPRLDTAAAVLLTLLDSTTPVAPCGPDARAVVHVVSELTRSPVSEVSTAEFILVVGDPADTIRRAPRGDRDRPESGATIVVVDDGAQGTLTLTGPGIPGRRVASLRLGPGARRERERANAAPPCGIDLFLLDDEGVVALPRTTIVEGAG